MAFEENQTARKPVAQMGNLRRIGQSCQRRFEESFRTLNNLRYKDLESNAENRN